MEEQVRLLAEDPHTPWARSTRKRLTADEKAALIASAANWLRLGQRVRITSTSPSIDGSKERTEKVVFVELRDVEPIED